MKEDNISQLRDYDAPFCEQQYTHESCYISFFKFKSFDQLIPSKLLSVNYVIMTRRSVNNNTHMSLVISLFSNSNHLIS